MGTKRSLILSVVLGSLLLSACTPVGSDSQSQSPSSNPSATGADVRAWEGCTDPVITAGKSANEEVKLVAGILLTKDSGGTETSVVFDQPVKATVLWEADGPSPEGFTTRIGEAIGYPLAVSTDFPDINLPEDLTAKGAFVIYKGIEPVSVPVTISCGDALKSTGVVKTWRIQEPGNIECALPGHMAGAKPMAAEAKKQFCPKV